MTHANSPIKPTPRKTRAGAEAGITPSCRLQDIRAADIAYNKPGKSRAVVILETGLHPRFTG